MTDSFRTISGANGWSELHKAQLNGLSAALVIPTNRIRTSSGHAVMGAGLARQAALAYPNLPLEYGRSLANGIDVFHYRDVICVPSKDHWRQPASLGLIKRGFQSLVDLQDIDDLHTLLIPKVGAGLGGLLWLPTKMALMDILADHASRVVFLE